MKSKIKISGLLIGFIICFIIFSNKATAQQSNVNFQVFYDELSPFGQWINSPSYGYVWFPDAGQDFVPYSTRGHWIQTEYGSTWLSDYEWGWAPFHYGRWDYDNSFGWFWIPDNEWGPAWVTWRRADGYYGWEPMEPGISISLSFGRQYDSRHDHWLFVRDRDFDRPDIYHFYVTQNDHDRIIRNSTVINNTYIDNSRHTTYVSGPAREDIQRATGRRATPVSIQENNRPGQDLSNGQLRIYRPIVTKNNDQGRKPAPSRIANLTDVKRPSERNQATQPTNVSTTNTNRREVKPNTVNPQNNNNTKAVQPVNAKPTNNTRREVQPNSVNPQNNNNTKVIQHTNAKPDNNSRREVKPNTVNPQNNNNTKVIQPTNAKPTGTVKQEVQSNKTNTQNNKNVKSVQSPNTKSSGNNNRRVKQPNTVKPSENIKKGQQEKSNSEQDKTK
jgi:hypothetical protein